MELMGWNFIWVACGFYFIFIFPLGGVNRFKLDGFRKILFFVVTGILLQVNGILWNTLHVLYSILRHLVCFCIISCLMG